MTTKGKGQQKDLQRQNINVYGWMIQLKEITILKKDETNQFKINVLFSS